MEIPKSFSSQESLKLFLAAALLRGLRIGVTFKSPFVPSIKKRIDGSDVPPPPNVHYQFSYFEKDEKNTRTGDMETVGRAVCVFHLATSSDPLNFKGSDMLLKEFCEKLVQTHYFFGGSYEILERKIFPKEWCPGLVSPSEEKDMLEKLPEELPKIVELVKTEKVTSIFVEPPSAPKVPQVKGRMRKISKPQNPRKVIPANFRPAGQAFSGTVDF